MISLSSNNDTLEFLDLLFVAALPTLAIIFFKFANKKIASIDQAEEF